MLGISISVIVGMLLGYFFKNQAVLGFSDYLMDAGLVFLLFFVGIDMGRNSGIFSKLKEFGKIIWFLPLTTVFGTFLGAGLASNFTTLSMGEALVVSSGMGWYSLSAIEISKVNTQLGSIAFLSNVFREFLAIFMIPFIAKRIGHFEAISAGAAPAMDTLLPVINRYTSSDTAVVSFFTGVVLSSLVPIIVPLMIRLFNIS